MNQKQPPESTQSSCVQEILRKSVQAHIDHPYRFPREQDFVCHVVQQLRAEFDQSAAWNRTDETRDNLQRSHAHGKAAKEKRIRRFTITREKPPTSRVRTEVKLDNKNQRIDVCVLLGGEVDLFHESYGVRDVVLKVNPEQVDSLIEVKMYSSTYVKKAEENTTGHGWLDDLIKLSDLLSGEPKKAAGHLVFIDTSLPFQCLLRGVRALGDANPKKRTATRERLDKLVQADRLHCDWPTSWLKPDEERVLTVQFGNHLHSRSCTVTLTPNQPANTADRLFLHAIGVETSENQTLAPTVCTFSVSVT